MLIAHMFQKLTVSVKLSLAVFYRAYEGLQVIVSINVILQITARCKSNVTEMAGVGFLTRVCSLVHQ